MSRQILAFSLALISIFGMVSADTKTAASAVTPSPNEDTGNSGTVESPVGSAGLDSGWGAAVAAGAMSGAATGQPPSSNSATTITVSSAFVGTAAITIAGYFVF
ncbi:hypothetical protein V6N13_037615 [Hibiscus sabdariffa]|uniref:Transmembrane protein n=1 Tax=Hibiscus sabdariffa TaxID=183260 RepID=A0ABR2S4S9_9ROSI